MYVAFLHALMFEYVRIHHQIKWQTAVDTIQNGYMTCTVMSCV